MNQPQHLPGHTVVRRTWAPKRRPGQRRASRIGWTLHRDTCPILNRVTNSHPAPANPYPDTTPCTACKPATGYTRTENH